MDEPQLYLPDSTQYSYISLAHSTSQLSSLRLLFLASTKIICTLALRALSPLNLNDVTIRILASLRRRFGGESYQNQLPQFNSPKSLVKSGVFTWLNHTIRALSTLAAVFKRFTMPNGSRISAPPRAKAPPTGHIAEEGDNIARPYQFGVDVVRQHGLRRQ